MGIMNNEGDRPQRKRVCHTCGATQTLRGRPLTGNYCGPDCLDRARSRPDSHGLNTGGRGYAETNVRDDYEGSSRVYNPLKELFDE